MDSKKYKLATMHAYATPDVFELAKELRSRMTLSEKKLWIFLNQKPNGYKFRRQHPFNSYVLDFYSHEARLSIEVDGEYHLTDEQMIKDEERTQLIHSFGISELRFSNKDVLNDFENVKLTILNAISLLT